MIKRYLMLSLKILIGVVPKTIRDKLKRWSWLTSLYSRSLQKSGLFYGIPTGKKLAGLYSVLIKKQNEKLSLINKHKVMMINVVVWVNDYNVDFLNDTMEACRKNSNIDKIYAITSNSFIKDKAKKISANKNIVFALNITELVSLKCCNFFMINSGDVIHSSLNGVLADFLSPKDDLAYVDTDNINSSRIRNNPNFLPDWNPDLQMSTGYVNTGVWLNSLNFIFDNDSDTSSFTTIAEILANFAFKGSDIKILHIPMVLVHQKQTVRSFDDLFSVRYIDMLQTKVVVEKHVEFPIVKLKWPTTFRPFVSLIIPTKNGYSLVKSCIESIFRLTTYTNYEILLVDNLSDDEKCLQYFEELNKDPRVRLIRYNQEFNYSAINNFAVKHAKGDVIGLINNDIEVIEPEWLSYMVGHAIRPEIGCVGAKLLYSDHRVQHAGVVLGYGGGAGHAHKYFPADHPGYLNRLVATQNYSAVTAACLLVSKRDYIDVGGLDEENLKVAFNDVDFCLKVRALGRRNLYCAEAKLFHHESVSRGFDDTKKKRDRFESELRYLQLSWKDLIECDPAYNPNLTLKRENFSIKEY